MELSETRRSFPVGRLGRIKGSNFLELTSSPRLFSDRCSSALWLAGDGLALPAFPKGATMSGSEKTSLSSIKLKSVCESLLNFEGVFFSCKAFMESASKNRTYFYEKYKPTYSTISENNKWNSQRKSQLKKINQIWYLDQILKLIPSLIVNNSVCSDLFRWRLKEWLCWITHIPSA